jgi:hypothetical protein
MTIHQMSLSNWWRLGQQRGLIALLNAVYNHFEIDGNYSHAYAPAFFNSTLPTPWGAAISGQCHALQGRCLMLAQVLNVLVVAALFGVLPRTDALF